MHLQFFADLTALKDLALGSSDESRINSLKSDQRNLMRNVLINKVQGLLGWVYYTRSLTDEENKQTVLDALGYYETQKPNKPPFKPSPPTVPLSQDDVEGFDQFEKGQYLTFYPSCFGNGCFFAVLLREVSLLTSFIELKLYLNHFNPKDCKTQHAFIPKPRCKITNKMANRQELSTLPPETNDVIVYNGNINAVIQAQNI
ncbi:hypothetical protein HELRODRAFT_174727 [Helobdella robusta]|uniref:Uncharacterized protein n=1 Tax=Helobdella robusta TaxID=6412 RepID=T1F8E6_HELRO|nr:hypothetical protein HELRODRAFT_174727 [Helobdella robusta]ESO01743.1 hypothetical protein HELRODRAFT_174727 [Helobdella robusta]